MGTFGPIDWDKSLYKFWSYFVWIEPVLLTIQLNFESRNVLDLSIWTKGLSERLQTKKKCFVSRKKKNYYNSPILMRYHKLENGWGYKSKARKQNDLWVLPVIVLSKTVSLKHLGMHIKWPMNTQRMKFQSIFPSDDAITFAVSVNILQNIYQANSTTPAKFHNVLYFRLQPYQPPFRKTPKKTVKKTSYVLHSR